MFKSKLTIESKNHKIDTKVIKREYISGGCYGEIYILQLLINRNYKIIKIIELIEKQYKYENKSELDNSMIIYNKLKKILPNNIPNTYRLTNKNSIVMSNLNQKDHLALSYNNWVKSSNKLENKIQIKDMKLLIENLLNIIEILSKNKLVLKSDSLILRINKTKVLQNAPIQPEIYILDYDKVYETDNDYNTIYEKNHEETFYFLKQFSDKYFSKKSYKECTGLDFGYEFIGKLQINFRKKFSNIGKLINNQIT